MMTKDETLFI